MKPSRQRAFHLPGFLALALCALTCSPTLLADLNTGLVAWYPFDGNASDMSGNGNHGTLQNGVALGTDRHGSAGKAYSFDGVDDYIKASNNNSSLSLTQSLTISVWIKPNSIHDGPLIYKNKYANATDNEDNYFLKINGSGTAAFSMEKTDGNDFSINSATVLSVGTWHQVAALYDGSYFRVYVDGKSSSQMHVGTFTPYSGPGPLQIGSTSLSNHGFISYFNGSLDEVRIYNRALSAAEVAELYAMESALPAGSVTLDKLSPELSNLLDGNGTIEQALPAGSVIAVKPGDPAPAGYTLFQRNEYNASLTWEEMAPVSVGRRGYDGFEVLDGKIYFVGGQDGAAKDIAERYDPATNQWETLNSMSVARESVAAAVLDGKLYAIGGQGLDSVETFDPQTGQWSAGPTLPSEVNHGSAITVDGKILLIGGRNSNAQQINQVLELDPATNQWSQKAVMPTARHGMKLVYFEGKVWAIGGYDGSHINTVEIYDVAADSWTTGPSLTTVRLWPSTWVTNGRIYVAGGRSSTSSYFNSIEVYDPTTNQWTVVGSLPENKYCADATVIDDKVYIMAGATSHGVYSNKVFAADLPPPAMNLYFKDGNATAEAATEPALDGNLSITLNMLASDALAKLDVSQTHAQSAGSVIAVPKDTAPPAGYSLYKRSDRNSSLVWEEKAPVSVARTAHDGVEVLDGKIYFAGGRTDGVSYNIAERYNPITNQWETLASLAEARGYLASVVLDGKFYAIGGMSLQSVDIFDPQTNQWSAGPALPGVVQGAIAITVDGKILLVGGFDGSQRLDQVLELDPGTNQWSQKTPMPTARDGHKIVLLSGKLWVIGGYDGSNYLNKVEIYDVAGDSWTTGPPLSTARKFHSTWLANGRIYAASGYNGAYLNSIETYDPVANQWIAAGSLPENKYMAGAAVFDSRIYLVGGSLGTGNHTAKVFAADITPPMDLYFRDANASGTITLDKFAGGVVSKLDGNASALPPIGAVSAIDHNDAPPADHAILERTDRNATHVWEEKAPVSVARSATDGVEANEGKLYFAGGYTHSNSATNIFESYDFTNDQWTTLAPMSVSRAGLSASFYNDKFFVFGGNDGTTGNVFASGEVYDMVTQTWAAISNMPHAQASMTAITYDGLIYCMGGWTAGVVNTGYVLVYDPLDDSWTQLSDMPSPRHGFKLVILDNKIWAIGGNGGSHLNIVQSFDPSTGVWKTEESMNSARHWPVAWVENNKIFVGGGQNNSGFQKSIEYYDLNEQTWTTVGELPQNSYAVDSGVINGRVYVAGARTESDVYSDKVFAADLIPHRDLYFREANATAPAQPAPNQAPVFSGGTATFTTAENNATATFVVTATDPDANTTLVYAKSGPDATKFDLNATTGVLTFLTPPDYEANASAAGNNAYQVTITVSDGTVSVTQGITVNILNDPSDDPVNPSPNPPVDGNASDPDPDPPVTLFRPLPKTLAREELGNGNFRLWGQVLADGGSPVTGVAFELADNMVFRNSTLHSASMLAGSPSFFGEFTLEPGKRYYYRAVATNAIGTTFGSPKRLITPPNQARWWTNAPEISGGWRNSSWLGAFRPYDNGWIYHAKLGWAYAYPDGSGGLWLWFRDHRWMWTRSGVFPYLWKHDLGTWHYLLGTRNGQPVFFDFATGSVR